VSSLTVREIMKILPHRYPMLLIDRITEFEPMVMARGYKNVSVNEPMLVGHFPNNPVLPGVYIIEAMAQLGGTTILQPGDVQRKTPYLAGIDKVKFRRPVIPGDRLDMEARVLRVKLNIGWVAVEATVDGKPCCAGELMYSVVSDPAAFMSDASVLHR
jgi:beta-hydroxyacyl-ACP dehydratase FabZ